MRRCGRRVALELHEQAHGPLAVRVERMQPARPADRVTRAMRGGMCADHAFEDVVHASPQRVTLAPQHVVVETFRQVAGVQRGGELERPGIVGRGERLEARDVGVERALGRQGDRARVAAHERRHAVPARDRVEVVELPAQFAQRAGAVGLREERLRGRAPRSSGRPRAKTTCARRA